MKKGKLIINLYNQYKIPLKDIRIIIVNCKFKFENFTDKCGIAEFCIPFGIYLVNIKGSKVKDALFKICIKDNKEFIRLKINEKNRDTGVICGIVKDKIKNKGIKDAFVILFKVEDESKCTPIKYTYTDRYGIYAYFNVPSGKYMVKAGK